MISSSGNRFHWFARFRLFVIACDGIKKTPPSLNRLELNQSNFWGLVQRGWGSHYRPLSDVVDFINSLRIVISGGIVIDPEVARAMMTTSRSGLGDLTPRESEVLELMAQGMSNNQIAQQLFLSTAAVAKHVSNIFSKLGLQPGEENRRVRAILKFLAQ